MRKKHFSVLFAVIASGAFADGAGIEQILRGANAEWSKAAGGKAWNSDFPTPRAAPSAKQ